jgi:hypothetical protein
MAGLSTGTGRYMAAAGARRRSGAVACPDRGARRATRRQAARMGGAGWVAAALAAGVIAIAVLMRTRASFPVALGCAAVAAGFATGAIKARVVDHAILRATAYCVAVSGFVESREERERSDRIVVRVTGMEGARLTDRPERIRLTVRKGRAPAVGSFVAVKARLNPPTSPLRPGGYDLARDLYFQGIGATGLVLGAITPAAPAALPGWRLRFTTAVEAIRDGIDARIPRGDTWRRRRHCFRPHHRQARRAHRQRVRCHVHFRRRPCAVGLRLEGSGCDQE